MTRRRPSIPYRPCRVTGHHWLPILGNGWGLFRGEALLFCVELNFIRSRDRRMAWQLGIVRRVSRTDAARPTFVVYRGLCTSTKEKAMRVCEEIARGAK